MNKRKSFIKRVLNTCILLSVIMMCSMSVGNVSQIPQTGFSMYEETISGSDLKIEMKAITGGKFKRGSSIGETGRKADEGPVKEIYVDDFWMSTYEVSWDVFQLFLYRKIDNVKTTNRGQVSLSVDGVSGATMPYVNFNRPGYSVVNITHYAASTFCKWLTAKTGRFYRLPTEAEWEHACRAGNNETYSFGNDASKLNKYAWYSDNSKNTFHKSGEKLPNRWGLYDMHGNVAEWVTDAYSPGSYAKTKTSNPVVFPIKLYPRVTRGGSWKDAKPKLRSAARGHSEKSWKKRDPQFPKSLWWLTDATHVGFRIVRPRKTPTKSEMEIFWGKPIQEY